MKDFVLLAWKPVLIGSLLWTIPWIALANIDPGKKAAILSSEAAVRGDLLQVILGLVMVLILILAGSWILRRLSSFPVPQGDVFKVLAGYSLGPRERIILIQVGKEQILLSIAPGRIDKLHVLLHPIEDIERKDKMQPTFAAHLRSLLSSRRNL